MYRLPADRPVSRVGGPASPFDRGTPEVRRAMHGLPIPTDRVRGDPGLYDGAMPSFPPRVDAARLARLSTRAAAVRGPRSAAIVHAPFTGEPIGRLPRMQHGDVREAARRARLAQKAWAALPAGERASVLLALHDRLLDRIDEALDLAQLETGKARRHAFEEVVASAVAARYYGVRAPRLLAPRRRLGVLPLVTGAVEYRRPHALVGVIVPWHAPLAFAAAHALPALAAGCAVLLEPDLQTSFTALWLAERLDEAGLPREVLQVVTGEGDDVALPLVEAVDHVAFTGRVHVGRLVAGQAGERLVGCTVDLCGKNAILVLADADLDRAVAGALRCAFAPTGPTRRSAERLLVHASVWDRFVPAFVEATRALRLGARFDFEADVGSLLSVRHLEQVEGHVRDAVARGARVLAGGRPRPDLGPCFYEPTILEGVTEAMRCFGEVTDGPVVALSRFDSLDEAVARANAPPCGRAAGVWTRSVRTARRLAARLEASLVTVNEGHPGAWAQVGVPPGRRHDADGLLGYTETRTVTVTRGLDVDLSPRALAALLRVVRRLPGLR